jgi:uncharacterized membrane protein
MNVRAIILYSILLVSCITAFLVYPSIQYPAVSHWDINGVPNGFVMPFWAVAFGPLTLVFLLLLWWVIPKIDPHKKNIESFRQVYDIFWIIISLFIFYVYALTLYWNTGNTFNITKAINPVFALLFITIGFILPRTKRNWFMGIRTPWTLASDSVWKKTHDLGGKLFIASGVIMLLGFFFPEYFLVTLRLI